MPTPIRAAVMPAPHAPIEVREFPEPPFEPGSPLLRTLYSELCGTDVHIGHGRLAGVPCPIIQGHVSVEVADTIRGELRGGDGARTGEGDQRVFVYVSTDSANDGLFGGWADAIHRERHHAAIPWRAIGTKTYTLSELNQALADAEAMRLPKARVKPH